MCAGTELPFKPPHSSLKLVGRSVRPGVQRGTPSWMCVNWVCPLANVRLVVLWVSIWVAEFVQKKEKEGLVAMCAGVGPPSPRTCSWNPCSHARRVASGRRGARAEYRDAHSPIGGDTAGSNSQTNQLI